jgi:hypothetical protein
MNASHEVRLPAKERFTVPLVRTLNVADTTFHMDMSIALPNAIVRQEFLRMVVFGCLRRMGCYVRAYAMRPRPQSTPLSAWLRLSLCGSCYSIPTTSRMFNRLFIRPTTFDLNSRCLLLISPPEEGYQTSVRLVTLPELWPDDAQDHAPVLRPPQFSMTR